MLFCDMPLFGASLEVISTEKTVRSLTFFRENYSSLILIVVIVDSYSRSSDYFKSLLLPQLLRGENDSKQSDEFQAKRNVLFCFLRDLAHRSIDGLESWARFELPRVRKSGLRIPENFARGIRNPKLWNAEYS